MADSTILNSIIDTTKTIISKVIPTKPKLTPEQLEEIEKFKEDLDNVYTEYNKIIQDIESKKDDLEALYKLKKFDEYQEELNKLKDKQNELLDVENKCKDLENKVLDLKNQGIDLEIVDPITFDRFLDCSKFQTEVAKLIDEFDIEVKEDLFENHEIFKMEMGKKEIYLNPPVKSVFQLFNNIKLLDILRTTYIYESDEKIKYKAIKHNLSSENISIQVWVKDSLDVDGEIQDFWFNDIVPVRIIDEDTIFIELYNEKYVKVIITKSRYDFIQKILNENNIDLNIFETLRAKLLGK